MLKSRRLITRHRFLPKPAPGRAIHLIDLENLVGASLTSCENVARIRRIYEDVAGVNSGDHVVIATGSRMAPAAWFGWEHARRLVRRGPDGADRALLEILKHEHLERRYGRVVVASGDGIFALPSAQLQEAGCKMTVVSRPEALSIHLRLAVRDVRYIVRLPRVPAASALLPRAA